MSSINPRPDNSSESHEAQRAQLESLETGQIPIIFDAKPAARIPTEIWVLLSATFFVAIGFGLIVPVLPQYTKTFGVDELLVGVVVSAFAFMRLITSPIAGRLTDRFGERTMYSLGMVIVAASSFATAMAGSYTQLLIFRGLGGVGSVMFTLAAASMVVKYSPPQLRGRVSSMWAGMFLIGGISGPFIGGLLAELGITVPFVAYGFALLVASAIVAFALRGAHERGAQDKAAPPMKLGEALQLPAYRATLIFGLANGWAVMGMRVAVVPLFVASLVPDEPWVAGTVVAVGAMGNVLALQWAGRASDRLGRRPLIIAGLAVVAAGFVMYALTSELWFVFVASVVAGFGSGLAAPAEQAALGDIIGRERSGGRVLAAFQMSQDAGQILGPIVAGWVVTMFGFSWSFAMGAAILLMALLAWVPAPDTLKRH
ncbi:MFS transporter [Gulosibacter hominis]|uniref:MFS transporter n=1 Tax=Gulosibacter hominis TaxID=2770504 RepID=UPI001919B838|nr:MFS transporter [Gulosibacter hominis]